MEERERTVRMNGGEGGEIRRGRDWGLSVRIGPQMKRLLVIMFSAKCNAVLCQHAIQCQKGVHSRLRVPFHLYTENLMRKSGV